MANQITKGVKITADLTDLDVKFLKSVEQLNDSLTRTQRSLKLTYNEQGLLTNAFGQCVEGLTVSQIKLGEYVDELGRVRTIQGGFVEGLNKSQIAMGQYVDELGRIYDAAGKMIGQSERAAKALEKQAQETAAAGNQARNAADAFGNIGGDLKKITNTLGSFTKEALGANNALTSIFQGFGNTINKINSLSSSFNKVKDTFDNLSNLPQNITNINQKLSRLPRTLGQIAGKAKALINPLTLAAGGLILVWEGLKKINQIQRDAANAAKLPQELQEAGKRAYAAGREIKNLGDALEFGAMYKGQKSELKAAIDELNAINETGLGEFERRTISHYQNQKSLWGDIMAGVEYAGAKYNALFNWHEGEDGEGHKIEELKQEQYAVINKELSALIDSQKTEREKLIEQLNTLRALQATGELKADQKAAIEKKTEELKDAIRTQTLKDIGVSLEKIPTASDEFKASLDKLTEYHQKGWVSGEDRAAAEEELARKYAERVAKESQSQEEIAEAEAVLKKAYDDHYISLKTLEDSQKGLAEATDKLKEAERQKLESELGVSFEKDKKPKEELEEKLAILEAKKDRLTDEEYNRAKEKLTAKYKEAALARFDGVSEFLEAGKKEKSEIEKYTDLIGDLNDAWGQGLIDRTEAQAAIKRAEDERARIIQEMLDAEKEEARLEKERVEKLHKERLSELGFDELESQAERIKENATTPYEKARKAFHNLTEALDKGEITQEEYNEAQKAWNKIRKEKLEEEKTEREKERADRVKDARGKLGVDRLMEELKSPLEKYQETMKAIKEAAKIKAISGEERIALEERAAEDYWKAMNDAGSTMQEAAQKANKFEMSQSMSGGSEALYLAQVKNSTVNYQTRMQAATERMASLSDETLYQTQQSTMYLQMIAERETGVWR